MNQNTMKQEAARAALEYLEYDMIIGVGTGSTVNFFIDYLPEVKNKIKGAVASSKATETRLKALNIPIFELNDLIELSIYIDGADEINGSLQMIKGGGGALTREKIIANASKKIICIADQTKKVEILGAFPLPIEVIPMARSYIGRELAKRGSRPVYREGFITDNGNVILDAWNFNILEPKKLEQDLNDIAGVVSNGLFALRPADLLLLGTEAGVQTF